MSRRGLKRRSAQIARLALAGVALVFLRAQSDGTRLDPDTGTAPSFAIVSQSPAEIRFRGVTLRNARTDDVQNQIALDFNQPVDSNLFDQLQQAMPDWVDMAYGGYDNAVIHARRPVQFLTRNEADGFSIRMVPAQQQAAAQAPPPPPPPACNGGCPPPDGAQNNDAPFALRGTDGLRGAVVKVSADFRRANHSNVYALRYAGTIPVGGGFKIVGNARAAYGNGDAVRHLDGTISPLRKSVISGDLGLAYEIAEGVEIRLAAIDSEAGFGGLFGVSQHSSVAKLGFSAAYRSPYLNNTEEIADTGSRDFARINGTFRLFPGLWIRGEGRYERFGVRGDDNVATTAGFTAGARYVPNWFGIPLGFAYDVDGDYVITADHYLDPSLTPFVPMKIHTREVHAASMFFNWQLDPSFSIDAFGGYAYDRYGLNGGFGGGEIAFVPADGWKLAFRGLYSQVPNRQSGSAAPVVSASVRLIYDLSSTEPDPFSPGFLPDEI